MGFPEIVITKVHADPYDDIVMPYSGEKPPKEQVLQNLHISTCLHQLEVVLKIRQKAEDIFTRIFADCIKLNDRLSKLDGRVQDLKEQSFGIQKLMESHSPENFMTAGSDEIVSLVHRVPGGLFNRSTSPAEVNTRRDYAAEMIPLNKFNRFWPCLEIAVNVPAERDLVVAHKYTNPRFFFDRWIDDMSNWRSRQGEKKTQFKKMFHDRHLREIEESSIAIIHPIERNYVDDMGNNYVKKIGMEKDLGKYDRVDKRLMRRERSKVQLVYGSGTLIDDTKIEKEEDYKLKEVDDVSMPSPAKLAKRMSEVPVPNLHKPLEMPQFSAETKILLETGVTPGPSGGRESFGIPPDSAPQFLKYGSMNVIDAIRKGSTVQMLRPSLPDRHLPSLPEENSPADSDVVFSGMKERFKSRAEEEGTLDLPHLPTQRQEDRSSIIADAPPLPSRSPQEPYTLSTDLNMSTDSIGEPSPRGSDLPEMTFQPGSIEAESFYKSESNHPVAPVPPRATPTPI